MRVRIVGVEIDGLPQQLLGLLMLLRAQPPEVRQCAHDQIPGIEAVWRLPASPCGLGRQDLRLDRPNDAVGDVVLQLENIEQLAIVSLRPQMGPLRGVDQLAGDPDRVGRLAHAAFQHISDAQLARDLANIDRLALVGECGISRDDEEPRLTRECRDDVLGEAVREVFLLLVAAHVLKRQDGDRGLVGKRQLRSRVPARLEPNPPDSHRPRNVLELALAGILEGDIELALHVLLHSSGHADAAGLGQRLQPRCHIHTITPHIVVVDDDVAEIDADAEHDPLLRRDTGVAHRHPALDFDRAAHGIDHAGELGEDAVAGDPHHPPVMILDRGLDEVAPMRLPLRECAFLVLPDQAAVAGYVGEKNGR